MSKRTISVSTGGDVGRALFVGAGPAGLAPLVWAARTGALPRLAARGLAVVETGEAVGAGRIGEHAIHSDTAAATFLECLHDAAEPELKCLLEHPAAKQVAAYQADALPLTEAAAFLRELGLTMVSILRKHDVPVITGRATASRRVPNGWATNVACGNERSLLKSSTLVLATGAVQTRQSLADVRIGNVTLAELGERVILSDEALSHDGLSQIRSRLAGRRSPSVAIVGGSHSAVSVAWRVLNELPELPLSSDSVALLHRRPLRPFYASPEDARSEGFTDFDQQDVCPLTGRLFRFAGFRFRARELVRQALGIGDAVRDLRLTLLSLSNDQSARAEERLRSADLVIAATGYRPKALPLFERSGQRIELSVDQAPRTALVNDDCQVLGTDGRTVDGVYALGLAAGFRPRGSLGGEPSFKGQTNGLWLWQNGIGQRIIEQLIGSAATV